jgi:transcriptional regulator with XRE-family HTH domain
MLIWARERAGLRLEDAAVKLDIAVEGLEQWEQGAERPSIAQLRKVGEVYKRPPAEVRVVSSIGRPFVSLVLEGYQRNAVSSADVVDYLGVQLKHLSKIARHLLPEPGFAAVA